MLVVWVLFNVKNTKYHPSSSSVVRGFVARQWCRKLREAARIQSKKANTFLAFANQSVGRVFNKQDEMLNMDNERKRGKQPFISY